MSVRQHLLKYPHLRQVALSVSCTKPNMKGNLTVSYPANFGKGLLKDIDSALSTGSWQPLGNVGRVKRTQTLQHQISLHLDRVLARDLEGNVISDETLIMELKRNHVLSNRTLTFVPSGKNSVAS